MGFCIQLNSIQAICCSEEFEVQLKEIGLMSDWEVYKSNLFRPVSNYDIESMVSQGRNFCHIRGIAVIVGSTIFMSCIPKRSGHVARYPVLEAVMLKHDLKGQWDDFFLGSAFGLLDNDGSREPINWGIFWQDADRFFSQHGLMLKPMLETELPIGTLLNVLRGNLKLSNLQFSEEQLDIARLATHGIISTREALDRLKGTRPR